MPIVLTEDAIQVWTDGSASLVGERCGALGYLIRGPDGQLTYSSKAYKQTTVSRMEMGAMIYALERVSLDYGLRTPVRVISDSKMAVRGITEWLPNWKRANWRNYAGEPIKNREVWERLEKLVAKFDDVRFKWVKGHSGEVGNEVVDYMCHAALREFRGQEIKRENLLQLLLDGELVLSP